VLGDNVMQDQPAGSAGACAPAARSLTIFLKCARLLRNRSGGLHVTALVLRRLGGQSTRNRENALAELIKCEQFSRDPEDGSCPDALAVTQDYASAARTGVPDRFHRFSPRNSTPILLSLG
jgi:hypothetical protein